MFQALLPKNAFSLSRWFLIILKVNAPTFLLKAAFSFCAAWLSGQKLFTKKTSGSTGIQSELLSIGVRWKPSAKATGEFLKSIPIGIYFAVWTQEYIAGKVMNASPGMTWQC